MATTANNQKGNSMANTAKTKKTNTTPPAKKTELLVIINKTEKAESSVNALAAPVVAAAEIVASDSIKSQLCLNILAGQVDPAIIEAHGKRGGLKRLFPGMANAEANALRICLDAKPAQLVAGWSEYTAKAKRVRCISLQALAKTIREPSDSDPKVTLRDALTAWAADNAEFLDNPKKCPASLLDIFIEFELIGETEGEA